MNAIGKTLKLPGIVAFVPPQKSETHQQAQAPSYDTTLTPEQEKLFSVWKQKNAPNDSGQDYDLRGFYLSGGGKDPRGHMTDLYKKPNHPTFSVESKYNGSGGQVGGKWVEKEGKTYFYASPTNLKYHSAEQLKEYFKKVEPDVILVLPEAEANGKPK